MYPAFAPHIAVRTVALKSGVNLRIAESGPRDGRPVVMLPGWGASLYMYRHALDRFPRAGIRSIAVDLRGYGLSDKPAADDSYSLKAYCADLDALLDELHLPTASLVGQSMGGGLALRYALAQPARVSTLTLINPTGLVNVPYVAVLRHAPAAVVDALGAHLVPRWIVGFILRRLAYADASIVSERDVDEYWAPTQLPGFVRAARATLSEFDWRAATDAEAASLTVPTLVVLGRRDRLVPNTNAAVSRLTASRIEWVPGGHCAHEEHPDLVYDMLAEFIR
jgi:pimeloyl-ACP methyl ester carboxylesterase